MELLRVQCPSCSGSLPPRPPSGTITCDYCGAKFQSQQVRHAQDQAGHVLSTDQLAKAIVAAQHEMTRQQSQRTNLQAQHMQHVHGLKPSGKTATKVGRGATWLMFLPVAMILAISGGVAAIVMGGLDGRDLFGGGTDAAEQLLFWSPANTPPIVTTVGGIPAIVGRVHYGSDSSMAVDAYDLDGNRLWRVDGLGSLSDVLAKTHLGAVDRYLVLSDANSTIRSFDLDTGSQVHSNSLSDSVNEICSPMFAPGGEPAGVESVWFRQVDERAFIFDPASGALTEAERPSWCPDLRHSWDESPGSELMPPEVDGVKIQRVHQSGDTAVALGVKSPGSEIPRAIGFDPVTKEVAWDQVISQVQPGSLRNGSTEHSGLAGGRFSATYGEGSAGWHVATIDATTGQLLWDVTLRPLFAADQIADLRVTPDYVLVVRWTSLEVFDAKTGKQLVVIGRASYDD